MFSQEALQEYLLICCQFPSGGLIDKPGRYVVSSLLGGSLINLAGMLSVPFWGPH